MLWATSHVIFKLCNLYIFFMSKARMYVIRLVLISPHYCEI